MPALPVITGAVKVSFIWTATGTPLAVTTLGFTTTVTDLTAFATIVEGAVTAGMWAHTTTGYSINSVHYFAYDGVTPTLIRPVTGTQWAGSAAPGDVVVAPAVLVSLRTVARGPWARGRMYLPFPAESSVSNGSLGGALVTSMQAVWNTFRTTTNGQAATMAVITLATNAGPPPRSPVARPVTSLTVEAPLATLRRRQDRLL